ncbi:MAG: N-acetylmuramoyl-L-alanine amidase [Candidatus Cloacimonetes bacterium]|nr:N-acetylmuramoyl-L-alanine amidase [Candidatus Cloacimonadota bacterium]
MLAKDILEQEKIFDETGIDAFGIKHRFHKLQIEIPVTDKSIDLIEMERFDSDKSYFYRYSHKKEQIILHHTEGFLASDIGMLTQKNRHVSTAFVIGRNGKIYNLFPSKYWSYHLGKRAVSGNRDRCKHSIAIELSNIGPLTISGNYLKSIYNKNYCHLDETEYYQETTFRGYDYFATFTHEQYDSLQLLILYLSKEYSIPIKILDEPERYETGFFAKSFRGILSHINFKKTGKTDIGPGFEWERIL